MTEPVVQALIVAHAAATGLMAGIIWFVQVVHYPLHGHVPEDGFVAYQHEHVRRAGILIGPVMLAELATAIALLAAPEAMVPRWAVWTGAGLLAFLWVSTFGISVPIHRRLERGRDPEDVRRLVLTNWMRTVAWSARLALALMLLLQWSPSESTP